MYTDILRGIEGIGIFPVIALLLFAAVFGTVLIWAIRADKTRMAEHAALPFDSGNGFEPFDSRPADSAGHSLRAGRTE